MVVLEKMIKPASRSLHSDLGIFILQSVDTFNRGSSSDAQFVMDLMQKSICDTYNLNNSDFNLVLNSYVSNLHKSSSSSLSTNYRN